MRCLNCGLCCRAPCVIITSGEKSIIESFGHSGAEPIKDDEQGRYMIKSRPCPYYDEHSVEHCSIYEYRPDDCQKYFCDRAKATE